MDGFARRDVWLDIGLTPSPIFKPAASHPLDRLDHGVWNSGSRTDLPRIPACDPIIPALVVHAWALDEAPRSQPGLTQELTGVNP